MKRKTYVKTSVSFEQRQTIVMDLSPEKNTDLHLNKVIFQFAGMSITDAKKALKFIWNVVKIENKNISLFSSLTAR